MADIPVPDDNVIDMHQAVVQQNIALVGQLRLTGRDLNKVDVHEATLATLLDVIFQGDDEQRAAFNLAAEIRLNSMLRQALGQTPDVDSTDTGD